MVKNIFKRKQIVLFTVALMLIVAGYMNYTVNTDTTLRTATIADSEKYAELGDARLVSSDSIVEQETGPVSNDNIESLTDLENLENNVNSKKIQNNSIKEENTTKQVNSAAIQYFTQSRIDRDNMYSQMIESYEKILSNENISEEQRNVAEEQITNINNRKNAIMISENLIKNKGLDDAIILVNDKSINVIIRADQLTQEQVAQIQNIIQREMGADTENIHISNK